MTPVLTDAEALRQSLAEPRRFEIVYRRYLAAVHGYLRRRVGDPTAEDLTAEVFVRAFRGRARYKVQHETALPWLLGIANNLIGDHRRSERRRLLTLERLIPLAKSEEGAPEARSLSPEIFQALRKLPARDRDTLLLIVWGELSYQEASHALGIPIGTVRSRVARARSRLSASMTTSPLLSPATPIAPGESHA